MFKSSIKIATQIDYQHLWNMSFVREQINLLSRMNMKAYV